MVIRFLAVLLLALSASIASAQTQPLRITIDQGVIEPMPIAVPTFVARDPGAAQFASQVTSVVLADLTNTGLFRQIPSSAYITQAVGVDVQPAFADWQIINAQALIAGSVSTTGDGRVTVDMRLWDVFGSTEVGQGITLSTTQSNWRQVAHRVADVIYTRLTGEAPYFDSEVVFVSESGPKNARVKRIAVMDQDGANVRFVTGGDDLVLAPRFSPNGRSILYTSYSTGTPQVYLHDLATGQRRSLATVDGMTFAPRFSPDGSRVIYSQTDGSNTDIYTLDLGSGARNRLTRSPAIDTAPSYSPDGQRIVFESDQGGSQQLYIMPASGGAAQRISFGPGLYGTPVWSPRGDKIAFTKQVSGRFHVGVMNVDGTGEQLLTASFLDEGPTWSPNGRVLMFFRETPGPLGAASLVSVDVTGRNLRYVETPSGASDPNWSGVRAN